MAAAKDGLVGLEEQSFVRVVLRSRRISRSRGIYGIGRSFDGLEQQK